MVVEPEALLFATEAGTPEGETGGEEGGFGFAVDGGKGAGFEEAAGNLERVPLVLYGDSGGGGGVIGGGEYDRGIGYGICQCDGALVECGGVG